MQYWDMHAITENTTYIGTIVPGRRGVPNVDNGNSSFGCTGVIDFGLGAAQRPKLVVFPLNAFTLNVSFASGAVEADAEEKLEFKDIL